MKYPHITMLAVLAAVASVPTTMWIASIVGPVVFPNPAWLRDESSIIVAWLILQLLAIALIVLISVLAVRRHRRTGAVDV